MQMKVHGQTPCVPGCQPADVCQVYVDRFVYIQARSYNLIVYYEWIGGRGKVHGIPDIDNIFFFSFYDEFLEHSERAFHQSKWQNASNVLQAAQITDQLRLFQPFMDSETLV